MIETDKLEADDSEHKPPGLADLLAELSAIKQIVKRGDESVPATFSVAQLAAYLGISTSQLDKVKRQPGFPAPRSIQTDEVSGYAARRYLRKDIDSWLGSLPRHRAPVKKLAGAR